MNKLKAFLLTSFVTMLSVAAPAAFATPTVSPAVAAMEAAQAQLSTDITSIAGAILAVVITTWTVFYIVRVIQRRGG